MAKTHPTDNILDKLREGNLLDTFYNLAGKEPNLCRSECL